MTSPKYFAVPSLFVQGIILMVHIKENQWF